MAPLFQVRWVHFFHRMPNSDIPTAVNHEQIELDSGTGKKKKEFDTSGE